MNMPRLDFLRRNLGYKILSVGISILLWLVVYSLKRPSTTRDEVIQPDIVNLPADMIVKGDLPSLPVRITGLVSAVEDYRMRQRKAVVDLADAKPGVNPVVDVVYRTENLDVEVTGPRKITVTLEKKARRDFKVTVPHDPSTQAGFVYDEPSVDPPRATVTGRASDVSNVARVVAIVNTDTTGAFKGTVDLLAQTANFEVVDAVTIVPSQVNVTLGLKAVPQTKTLFLKPTFNGKVAPGFYLEQCTFEPPTVTVSGPPSQVVRLQEVSVPIDVDGLRETVTRRVPVPLPKGLSIVTPESGTVSVRLQTAALPTGGIAPAPTPLPSTNPTPGIRPSTAPRPTPASKENP